MFDQTTKKLIRALDFDHVSKIPNAVVYVRQGSIGSRTTWAVEVNHPFIFNSHTEQNSDIRFVPIVGNRAYSTSVIISGIVTNPYWKWTKLGGPLYVSPSGQLVESDPRTGGQPQLPVGKVVATKMILFNPVQPECLGSFELFSYELSKFESGVDSVILEQTTNHCADDELLLTNKRTTVATTIAQTLLITEQQLNGDKTQVLSLSW